MNISTAFAIWKDKVQDRHRLGMDAAPASLEQQLPGVSIGNVSSGDLSLSHSLSRFLTHSLARARARALSLSTVSICASLRGREALRVPRAYAYTSICMYFSVHFHVCVSVCAHAHA